MSLRFADMRWVEAPEHRDQARLPWLAHLTLAPHERRQLVWLVRLCAKSLTPRQIFQGSFEFFEAHDCGPIVECSLEWWNVIDDQRRTRYQLWLYAADSGYVFHAGTTRTAARICQCNFDDDVAAKPVVGLGAELAAAQARVSR